MNKRELQDALKAKGIAFSVSATNAELEALLSASETNNSVDNVIDDNLLKLIRESGGVAFDSAELQEQLKREKEDEYPDFGRDIPDGTYSITGFSTLHDWKNKKTGNVSHIRTAFISSDSNAIYELPFAALSKNQWDFVKFDGKDSEGKVLHSKVEMKSVLPYYSSIADRNLAVTKIAAGTKVKVLHAMGHYDNPYRTGKIFNFLTTWAELA